MNESDGSGRHPITTLGLSFPLDPEWAFDTMTLDDGVVVTARLSDEALFFVRYGPGQTLEIFKAHLGDSRTEVRMITEGATTFAGHPAQRMTLSLTPIGKAIPRPRTPRPFELVMTALAIAGTPVLIGYRLPSNAPTNERRALERVVAGVEITES